ncbi:MAG: aminotransferase class V-fold PLP-dependent enzyme [Oscillospiraceae bacterium]|nr:aminotransferase class V-fold PLP-dependent enzyme [Oscillospiraceae bacterium]
MIYLDNAATTLRKPDCVAQAVCAALGSFGNDGRGTHEGSLGASRVIYETRERIASLFSCARADHVVFTANSTEALNIAINGALGEGGHVLSTDLEHNSVLRPLYRLQQERGVEVDFLHADTLGRIDYGDFERLLRPNTRALVCTHASNLVGNMLDIARIGAFAREHGLLFIVDASQTAGAYPIDMERMGIDVLCFTGHKSLMGPQGTGGLCIREGVELRRWKVGGSGVKTFLTEHPGELPTRLEAGTLNGHGIAGLHAALGFIESVGVDTIHAHEIALMRRFYDAVRGIEGVTVYGDFGTDARAPIVALNVRGYASDEVADELSEVYGIATRAGAHCAPRLHCALGTREQGAVRFSFGYFNTAEEVDAAAEAVRRIAQ